MPEISRFYGIRVGMVFKDHNPPHFHVVYSGTKAVFDVRTLEMIEGNISRRTHMLVVEWALLHRWDIMAAWELAVSGKAPGQIEPLD